MRKGVIGVGVVVLAAGAAGALYSRSRSEKDKPYKLVEVTRGPVVEKALAVGRHPPQARDRGQEQDLGHRQALVPRGRRSRQRPGDPLFEILPDPTPMELTEARREVEIARNIFDQAKKRSDRTAALSKQGIVSNQDSDQADKEIQDAQIRLNLATERLALVEKGRVRTTHLNVESIIRAPVTRHRAGAARQRGRPGGAADVVSGGHRPHHAGRHVAARLQGHRRRDRRGQAQGGHAGAHQDRRHARRGGGGHRLQDRAQVQDGGRGHAVRRRGRAQAGLERRPARRLLRQRRHRGAREDGRAAHPGAPGHLRRRQGHDRGAAAREKASRSRRTSRSASPTASTSRSRKACS